MRSGCDGRQRVRVATERQPSSDRRTAMRTIGVISDTHGLLREEALDALAGVERIIHAGDVGASEILDRLASIAPVFAVRGNTDYGAFGAGLPMTAAVELGPEEMYAWVLHDIADLDLDPEGAGFQVVVVEKHARFGVAGALAPENCW